MRALSAVIRLRLSFFFSLSFPAGSAVWPGAGGEVEASKGMVAVVFPEWDFCRPRECSSGAKKSLTKAGGSLLFLVSRRPWNDPSGAWRVEEVGLGGLTSSPELSVGGEGAWTGPVASVGSGAFAVCVRSPMGHPLSPELTVRANGDAVDWTFFPPLE